MSSQKLSGTLKNPSASGKKPSLLVVEDNAALAENLYEFLGSENYVIDFAQDGLTALHLVATNTYDVIVLDVMLPGINGFDLCSRIRDDLECETPIIFMTARDTLVDKEQGFMRGGDDYLVKPFELRELQLRIDSLCRRRDQRNVVRAGSISFDTGTLKAALPDGRFTELSGTAAKLFEALVRAYPAYVSYEAMSELIWGDSDHDVNTIRTHIYGLRKSLQQQLEYPLIRTVHSLGYRLIPPEEDSTIAE
jgi:DNA-binding response OmpR family regulator